MMRRNDAARLKLLAVAVCFAAGVTSQDNGQKASQLKNQVSGTLPNAQAFKAASTSVDTAAYLGVLASGTPRQPIPTGTPQTGILRLGLSSNDRDGYLFVPASYDATKGLPMIVVLHAARKGGLDALGLLYDQANNAGVMLLAPDSRGPTWDALPVQGGQFGPDVAFIGAAMAQVFQQYNVIPGSLGIQGFSDGATYALGLGMINGKLFSKIMANSPGGVIAQTLSGTPLIFMSAGLQDDIFTITQAANPTACCLLGQGYSVTYIQFTGRHEVPPQIATDTVQWFLGKYSATGSFPAGICTALG